MKRVKRTAVKQLYGLEHGQDALYSRPVLDEHERSWRADGLRAHAETGRIGGIRGRFDRNEELDANAIGLYVHLRDPFGIARC